MSYAVIRYDAPFEKHQRAFLVGSFATKWEAEKACRVFRDEWNTDVAGEALFVVVSKQQHGIKETP